MGSMVECENMFWDGWETKFSYRLACRIILSPTTMTRFLSWTFGPTRGISTTIFGNPEIVIKIVGAGEVENGFDG
jgi:hypothetical protein